MGGGGSKLDDQSPVEKKKYYLQLSKNISSGSGNQITSMIHQCMGNDSDVNEMKILIFFISIIFIEYYHHCGTTLNKVTWPL